MANVVTNASCHRVGTAMMTSAVTRTDDGDGDRVDPPAADGGQPLEEVVAQRQRLAAEEHPRR